MQFVPSEANFILTLWPSAGAANDVVESLLRAGVIVRPMAAFGVPNGVRITIGSEEENEMLIAAMCKAVATEELVLCS